MRIALLLSLIPILSFGMDRMSALSMLETGDDDTMVGRAGEISRYQVMRVSGGPSLLHEVTPIRLSLARSRSDCSTSVCRGLNRFTNGHRLTSNSMHSGMRRARHWAAVSVE